MKKLLIVILFFNVELTYSQSNCENYCLDFEDTICLTHLNIDTANPLNIWQIGKLHKPSIDTNVINTNVIVTDTINNYPINNYSEFVIYNLATYGDIYGMKMLIGQYLVKTDTLNDYGKIEFSPDNGTTWIDIINDTVYSANIMWYSPVPVLTGNSGNFYQFFDVLLADNGSVFNLQLGDTLLYRFSFTSDSIFDNLGGLLFDNICFYDFVEGISETRFKPIKSKIYPNPVTESFTIEFENLDAGVFQLAVYDIHSKPILTQENITDNKVTIHCRDFKPNTYVYKLTNLTAVKRSWGKFIKLK